MRDMLRPHLPGFIECQIKHTRQVLSIINPLDRWSSQEVKYQVPCQTLALTCSTHSSHIMGTDTNSVYSLFTIQ